MSPEAPQKNIGKWRDFNHVKSLQTGELQPLAETKDVLRCDKGKAAFYRGGSHSGPQLGFM